MRGEVGQRGGEGEGVGEEDGEVREGRRAGGREGEGREEVGGGEELDEVGFPVQRGQIFSRCSSVVGTYDLSCTAAGSHPSSRPGGRRGSEAPLGSSSGGWES